jgi:hypothetical protein
MRLRGRGGSPSRPSTRANHAAFFSLFIGSLRKNGRLGDQALPSLNPDSEVKNRARGCRRARARSVGIVRRNKARIFSHHFVALA